MMSIAEILLVEDDRDIVENLKGFLKEEGFQVAAVSGQPQAMEALEEKEFGLVLLDVTLEEENGYGACTAIKSEHDIPVIFLTALGNEFSVVTGLDVGADDYVSKPFRPRELVSRMKNVLRRWGKNQGVVRMGNLTVDTVKGTVQKEGKELFLSAMEYRLLLMFVNHRGMVLTRSALLEEIWDAAGEVVNDNTLTVYIKRLREKIEDDPANPKILLTVRGLGYKAGE